MKDFETCPCGIAKIDCEYHHPADETLDRYQCGVLRDSQGYRIVDAKGVTPDEGFFTAFRICPGCVNAPWFVNPVAYAQLRQAVVLSMFPDINVPRGEAFNANHMIRLINLGS